MNIMDIVKDLMAVGAVALVVYLVLMWYKNWKAKKKVTATAKP